MGERSEFSPGRRGRRGMSDPITPQQQDAIRRWAAANVSTLLYNQPANPNDPIRCNLEPGPKCRLP